jgi:prepilin-type N-terminal cleavage/methylation domain-containing protein
MKIKKNQGFTLTELMAVTAIIGIITLVGVPKYQAYKAKGVVSQAKVTLDSIWTAQQSFFMANDRYSAAAHPGADPTWWTRLLSSNELGIIVPAESKYDYGMWFLMDPKLLAFAHLKNFWTTKLASCSADVGDARYKWDDGSSSANPQYNGLTGC